MHKMKLMENITDDKDQGLVETVTIGATMCQHGAMAVGEQRSGVHGGVVGVNRIRGSGAVTVSEDWTMGQWGNGVGDWHNGGSVVKSGHDGSIAVEGGGSGNLVRVDPGFV